jgi:hypothetical protein
VTQGSKRWLPDVTYRVKKSDFFNLADVSGGVVKEVLA